MLQTELETWEGAALEGERSNDLLLNQLIDSQCFQVMQVEKPSCESGPDF